MSDNSDEYQSYKARLEEAARYQKEMKERDLNPKPERDPVQPLTEDEKALIMVRMEVARLKATGGVYGGARG